MEYTSNSYKSREANQENLPEKKVEKVIKGAAKTNKKSGFSKFFKSFIQEDIDDVKSYIFQDIVVPAVKDIIVDAVKISLGMGGGHSKSNSAASKVSYRKYYDEGRRRGEPVRTRVGYDYDDIILESRGEAEEVLSRMDEIISVYRLVSVADLYDLVGISGNHTDNKYGWTDIRSASVVRVRDGYLIKMPKALPLD